MRKNAFNWQSLTIKKIACIPKKRNKTHNMDDWLELPGVGWSLWPHWLRRRCCRRSDSTRRLPDAERLLRVVLPRSPSGIHTDVNPSPPGGSSFIRRYKKVKALALILFTGVPRSSRRKRGEKKRKYKLGGKPTGSTFTCRLTRRLYFEGPKLQMPHL